MQNYKVEYEFYEKAIAAMSLPAAVKNIAVGFIGSEKKNKIYGKVLKNCSKNDYELLTLDQVQTVRSKYTMYIL